MALPSVASFRTAFPEFDSPVLEDGPLSAKLRHAGALYTEANFSNYETVVRNQVAFDVASTLPASSLPIPLEAYKVALVTAVSSGQTSALDEDSESASLAALLADSHFSTDEFTAVETADPDGIATGASSTSSQTLAGSDLNGAIGASSFDYARTLQAVFSNHADWDATTMTIVGTDVDGAVLSEGISIPNGGNATVLTTKAFASVVSVAIPAQSGTGGTFTLGTADSLGLSKSIKVRQGSPIVLLEKNSNDGIVTTGAFVSSASSAPHGLFTPADAPDGNTDYLVTYERS